MSAYLLGNRALILGFVAALGIVAPGPAAGNAPDIDPDGNRVSPDPIVGPATPSLTRKSSAGELDTSFAGDGTTWSYLPGYDGGPYVQDVAEAVAVDAAGGIIVAAHRSGNLNGLPRWPFAIVRHNADGAPDTTFGSNGVATPFAGRSGEARAMAIQPDGRIVVAGYSGDFSGGYAVARLMPDGSPDASFGSGGEVLTVAPPGTPLIGLVHAVALQADGRIVVAGRGRPDDRAPQAADSDSNSFASEPSGTFATLARYNTDGSLDTTFGSGGVAHHWFPDGARAMAVQPDGRIVVAGFYFDVTRFNANGTIDTGFGYQGRVTVPFGDEYWTAVANAIVVQPDSRIVVAGEYSQDFAIARLNADGSLDNGFGQGGMATTDFHGGSDSISALVLQPDGRLVAAGNGPTSHRLRYDDHFALVRYEPDGALDRSFGKGGRATAAIDDPVHDDYARALVLQPDGRLVAAGNVKFVCEDGSCGSSGYALARFLP